MALLRAIAIVVAAALAAVAGASARPAQTPQPVTLRIIFQEGMSARQMADRVSAVRRIAIRKRNVTPRLTGVAYTAAVRAARAPREFLPQMKRRSVEGFLFPALYEFTPSTTAATLVSNQVAAFEQRWRTVDLRAAERRGRTPYDVLTIASMIERETVAPEERRLVAAVIYNRLERGMVLGIDATLRYGLGIPRHPVADERASPERFAVQHAALQGTSTDPDRQPGAGLDSRGGATGARRLPLLRPQAGRHPSLLHGRRRGVLPQGARVRLQLLAGRYRSIGRVSGL